jgi:hypothetical protein
VQRRVRDRPSHKVFRIFVYKRIVFEGDSELRAYVNKFNSFSGMNFILELYFPMLDGNEFEKALNVFNQHEVL